MEFGEYIQRVKAIENSNRSDAAKKADLRELQKGWQVQAKKNIASGKKRNDFSSINKKLQNREEMRREELEHKWNQ